MDEVVETRLATLSPVGPDIVAIRFRPDTRLDVPGLMEVQQARRKHFGDVGAVLVVLVTDPDFDVSIITTDLSRKTTAGVSIPAIAVVAPEGMAAMISKLYFAYFPRAEGAAVFQEEAPALRWLEERIGPTSTRSSG